MRFIKVDMSIEMRVILNELVQANEVHNHCFIIVGIRMNVLVHLLIKLINLLDQILLDTLCKERMSPGQLKEKNFPQATPQIGTNF